MPTPKKPAAKKSVAKTPRSKKTLSGGMFNVFSQQTIQKTREPASGNAIMNYVCLSVDKKLFYKYDDATLIEPIQTRNDKHDSDIKAFYAALVEYATRRPHEEPGCLSYNVVRDPDNIYKFHIYEIYENAEALKQHGSDQFLSAFRKLKTDAGIARGNSATTINKQYALSYILPTP